MPFNFTLLSVLFIVLLFIPGFIFKRFYFSGQFAKQFGIGNFAEKFITSVFGGFVIQFLSLYLTRNLFGFTTNGVNTKISEFYYELSQNKIPDCTKIDFNQSIEYIIITNLLAIFLGWMCHKIVRLFRIDVKVPAFRFANNWHYYFKGDMVRNKTNRKNSRVVSTEMDVNAEDGKGATNKYSGFLLDYTLSENGELETITLTDVVLVKDDGSLRKIDGDCLIIPYKKMISLNIRYNTIKKESLKWNDILFSSLLVAAFGFALSSLITIPYFYYNKIGLIRVITAILFLFFDVLLFLAFFSIYLTPTKPGVKKPPFFSALLGFGLLIAFVIWLIKLLVG